MNLKTYLDLLLRKICLNALMLHGLLEYISLAFSLYKLNLKMLLITKRSYIINCICCQYCQKIVFFFCTKCHLVLFPDFALLSIRPFSNLQFPLTTVRDLLNLYSLSFSIKLDIPEWQCSLTLLTTLCIVGGVTSRSLSQVILKN